MKSPNEIAVRLAKQWHQPSIRVERLLSSEAWPLEFPIGKPTGAEFVGQTKSVESHIRHWREVEIGEVIWEPIKYRAGAKAVSMPVRWILRSPSEWIAATADKSVKDEFSALEHIVSSVHELFREPIVRNRSIWRGKDIDEVVTTARLAESLSPGDARGRPLRLLGGLGIDTKFFERNGSLLICLLDERYDGLASELGLHAFLDAYSENDHWVMLTPLDQHLLPFQRMRVPTSELSQKRLPGSHVLVVENEQCIHLLPELAGTIAILGAGLDLQWLGSEVFDDQSIGYWGDMDTWGLLMLARARLYRASVESLLMNQSLFDCYSADNAVHEPALAQQVTPEGLTETESRFYDYLLTQERGRLEQEYLPEAGVKMALKCWRNKTSS
ncbi:hypothetical protein OLMES_5604 [Oleiphilus messinensis]|uniref:Wadjet protein JetD C-terminal domain-containing protein n=1 Tax=Oleiphilus messinensis TaxID=141451 RepID=A0A1Y0IJH0_9GAMM|nr:Wadjet anti-phage system protein JetD domain-containing protein [Oleiphilus messinensis]ARU59583.1 hypothetical protein OLMES_5604 [Oleiphilus messinensis]